MVTPSTTTYSLLGLLAVQSWTGYELTQQARRSLRYVWPASEAHLYREQHRLVSLGWAAVAKEPVGNRTRNRYTITPEGRTAFAEWLASEPSPPRLEVEALVRTFFADHGSVDDLGTSLRSTAGQARSMIDDMLGYVDDYLATGGPYPQRLHVIALAADLVTDILARIESFCIDADAEVQGWDTTTDLGLTDHTRDRFERILDKHRLGGWPSPGRRA